EPIEPIDTETFGPEWLEPEPIDPEPELAEPEPDPKPRRRRRRRPKPEPEPEVVAEPEPEPPPKPAPAPRRPDPPTAKELIVQARAALRRGDASEAYELASRSNRARGSEAALSVMTLAACKQGNESRAKRAFKQIPLTRRGNLRRDCRQAGVRVGI
ncbi:MAG: hypothetical protein AB1Z98_21635, partial [Nannocystaceae bacterium]